MMDKISGHYHILYIGIGMAPPRPDMQIHSNGLALLLMPGFLKQTISCASVVKIRLHGLNCINYFHFSF